jgi:hypothetical protein
MAKHHRSYKGEMIDFDLMTRQNQDQLAIGNASMNARGDIIGPGGKVVQTLEQRIAQTKTMAGDPNTAYAPNVKGAVKMVSIKDNVDQMTSSASKMKEMADSMDITSTPKEAVKQAESDEPKKEESNKRKVVDKDD